MNIKNVRKETIDFIRRNVNYVNQQMTLLERRDETSSSRTYQFVQDRLRNDYRTKINKEGNVRFKSTKAELDSLSTNQLKALQKSLQDYKDSKTGTLRKVLEFKEKMTKMFKERFEKQTGQKFTEKAKSTMSDIYNHKNYSRWIEAFASDSILRLVSEIGIEPTYDLLDEFNDDVPIAYMDKRINDEIKKTRERDKDRNTSNFTFENNNFWS